jgi:hypothetical protein
MGANTSLALIYTWLRRGERARHSVSRNRSKNTTLLASMTVGGMGECLAVEGSTTAAVFEAYVEQVLAPTLRAGEVVVMDNLSAHKGKKVRELVEARSCELLYLCRPTLRRLTHRGSVRQDQGSSSAEVRSQDPSGFGRGDGRSDLKGHGHGGSRLLQALRIPSA